MSAYVCLTEMCVSRAVGCTVRRSVRRRMECTPMRRSISIHRDYAIFGGNYLRRTIPVIGWLSTTWLADVKVSLRSVCCSIYIYLIYIYIYIYIYKIYICVYIYLFHSIGYTITFMISLYHSFHSHVMSLSI